MTTKEVLRISARVGLFRLSKGNTKIFLNKTENSYFFLIQERSKLQEHFDLMQQVQNQHILFYS
jgi:hypothetical protein